MKLNKQSAEENTGETIILKGKEEFRVTTEPVNFLNLQQPQRQNEDKQMKLMKREVFHLIDRETKDYQPLIQEQEQGKLKNLMNFAQKHSIIKISKTLSYQIPYKEQVNIRQISEEKLNSLQFEQFLSNNQKIVIDDYQQNHQHFRIQNNINDQLHSNKDSFIINDQESYRMRNLQRQGNNELQEVKVTYIKNIKGKHDIHKLSSEEIQQISKDVELLNTANYDDIVQPTNNISPIKSLLEANGGTSQIQTKISSSSQISLTPILIDSQNGQTTNIAKSFPIRNPQLFSYKPFLSEVTQITPFYYPLYRQKIPKKDQIVKVQKLQINKISQQSEKQVQIQFTMNFRKQPLDISHHLKNKAVKIESLIQMPINRKKLQKYQFLTTVSKPINPGKQQQISMQEDYQLNIQQELKVVKNIFSYKSKQSNNNERQSSNCKISFINQHIRKPKLILQQNNQPTSLNDIDLFAPYMRKKQHNSELWQSGNAYQFPYGRWSYQEIQIPSEKIDFNFKGPQINNPHALVSLDLEGLSDRQDIKQRNSQRKVKIELFSPRAQKISSKKEAEQANNFSNHKISLQDKKQTQDKKLAIQLYQKIEKEAAELQKRQSGGSPTRKQRMKITQIVKTPVEKKVNKEQQSPVKEVCQNNAVNNNQQQNLQQKKIKKKMCITLKNRNINSPQSHFEQSHIREEYGSNEEPIKARVN